MMRICGLGFLACLSLNHSGLCDPAPQPKIPQVVSNLTVVLAQKSYGLFFVASPDTPCPFLRYRVLVAGKTLLTPVLRPGEAMIANVGQGLMPGTYRVSIESVGCAAGILALRPIVRRKASPDHGARALAASERDKQNVISGVGFGLEPA